MSPNRLVLCNNGRLTSTHTQKKNVYVLHIFWAKHKRPIFSSFFSLWISGFSVLFPSPAWRLWSLLAAFSSSTSHPYRRVVANRNLKQKNKPINNIRSLPNPQPHTDTYVWAEHHVLFLIKLSWSQTALHCQQSDRRSTGCQDQNDNFN